MIFLPSYYVSESSALTVMNPPLSQLGCPVINCLSPHAEGHNFQVVLFRWLCLGGIKVTGIKIPVKLEVGKGSKKTGTNKNSVSLGLKIPLFCCFSLDLVLPVVIGWEQGQLQWLGQALWTKFPESGSYHPSWNEDRGFREIIRLQPGGVSDLSPLESECMNDHDLMSMSAWNYI